MNYPYPFHPNLVRMLAFDIDGTLFSSESIILDTYIAAFENHKKKTGMEIRIPNKNEIMEQVGKPVKTIFSTLVPELSEQVRDEISDSILELLCDKILNGEGEVYPNALKTLEYLKSKGLKFVCASNGRLPYVSSILARIGVLEMFEEITVLNYRNIQTKKDIISDYIGKFRLEPESILMIGDRFSDYEAAEKNSCPFAFCEYGHASPNEIPSFSINLKSFDQLQSIF
jgi:phosphoglycolate phosphatase